MISTGWRSNDQASPGTSRENGQVLDPDSLSMSDSEALSDGDLETPGRVSALWATIDERIGEEQTDLEAAADHALLYLDRLWPHLRWIETCLVIAAKSSVALWTQHRDAAAAYQRLQPVADKILSLGWHSGGPYGRFEAHDVRDVLLSLSQCEAVLAPRSRNEQR